VARSVVSATALVVVLVGLVESSNVAWLIRSIILDAVQRPLSSRTLTQRIDVVEVEFEVSPTFANCDASTTVARVFMPGRVSAPSNHAFPCLVEGMVTQTVEVIAKWGIGLPATIVSLAPA
jgi:hypothetical protein